MGYSYHVRLQLRIPCPECGVELTAVSMTSHRCHMHSTEPKIDCNCLTVSQTENHPQVYDVRFPRKKSGAPAPSLVVWGTISRGMDCAFTLTANTGGGSISILGVHQNLLPKCESCSSQVPLGRLNTRQYVLENCKQGEDRRLRRDTLQC